jgi:hypothetical protein
VSENPQAGSAKPFAYTPNQRRQFNAAADRLCGKKCKDDWWIIGNLYASAARAAFTETGETSRCSKIWQNRFSEIIHGLAPIAENEATAERYRQSLLRIILNEDGTYDQFDVWYQEHHPPASNPVTLETQYLAWVKEQEPKPDANTETENESEDEEEEEVGSKEQLVEQLAHLQDRLDSQRGTAGDNQAALNYLEDWTAEQIDKLIPVLQERAKALREFKALRESQESKEPTDAPL